MTTVGRSDQRSAWLASVVSALAVGLAFGASAARAGDLPTDIGDVPPYHAADSDAAPVSPATILENERFWPYQVGLVRPWKPEGREQPLPVEVSGVLVRIDSPEVARIDFGRDGIYDVPVEATDLIERANRVRRGEIEKVAPNYVLTVGSRLIDAAADPPAPVPFRKVSEQRGFVSVFADPGDPGFGELVAELAPLREHPGVLMIVFPQGEQPRDAEVWKQLRDAEFPVAFVRDFLAGPYTNVLLPDDLRPPAVLVQTLEGRILYRSAWSPETAAEVTKAVEGAFPRPTEGSVDSNGR